MTDEATTDRREAYAPGYSDRVHEEMARRRADEFAGFFLPYLASGMRLLDVGCGPGSVTLDLAALVAPGEVVGVDIEPQQVERARALAAERGVTNARFERGDAYALPFPDGAFDAVFAHAVLTHLRDPLAALMEFRRVLRPGGVVGIRDLTAISFLEPARPLLEEFGVLLLRVTTHIRGRPMSVLDFQQRRLLREAGLTRTEAYAETRSFGTPEMVRQQGLSLAAYLDERFRPIVLAEGWADAEKVDAMVTELRAWAERPDSFGGQLWCAAVGWADELGPAIS